MNRTEARHWNLRYAAHLGLRQPDGPLFRASAGSTDPESQIRYVAEIGFAGVFDNFLRIRPVAEQRLIGASLARHGLAMGSFVNSVQHWNAPLWGSTAPEARAQIESDVQASIDAARRVQGRHVTVTSGRSADAPLREQHLAMIDNLRRVADRAARAGIVLMLEATNEDFLPGMLVFRAADALAIVEAVGHPAVQIVFDVAHVHATEGEVLPALESCWPHVATLQVADNPGRIDLGAGTIDWQAVLGCVRRRDYAGLVEIEHLPLGAGVEGERALLARLAALDATL